MRQRKAVEENKENKDLVEAGKPKRQCAEMYVTKGVSTPLLRIRSMDAGSMSVSMGCVDVP